MVESSESALGGRERLLSAARSLFGRGSYSEVSVGQVLQIAGVQAPTLYHHFGDKEGLYVSWATDAFGRMGAALREVPQDGSTEDVLRSFAEVLIGAETEVAHILHDARRMAQPENGERIMNAYFEEVFEPLCGLLMKATLQLEILPEPADRLAHLFISVANSGSIGGAADVKESAAWLVERFLRGIQAHPTSQD